MNFAIIMPIVISFFALIVSIVNAISTKRKIATETISKNRIEWIKEVRKLLNNFLSTYCKDDKSQDLLVIRNNICLYMRSGVNSYDELIQQMDECIKNGYSEESCKLLIEKSQVVLSEVWIRMKREAGISKKNDNKYSKLFENNK